MTNNLGKKMDLDNLSKEELLELRSRINDKLSDMSSEDDSATYDLNSKEGLLEIYDELSFIDVSEDEPLEWNSIFDWDLGKLDEVYEEETGKSLSQIEIRSDAVIQYLINENIEIGDLIIGKSSVYSEDEILSTIRNYL
jgi:hypothetical protein